MTLLAVPPSWSLQPFERDLALLELQGLTGRPARWSDDGIAVDGPINGAVVRKVRRRGGLIHAVRVGKGERPTVQAQLELSVDGGRRKVTSHALHGLHAYKGKFYPQLARAALNAAGVRSGGRVLDPFAGCGTTVLEGALLGLQGHGIDANPIAVLVSQAKLAMLSCDPEELSARLDVLRHPPRTAAPVGDPVYLADWLPPGNYEYLGRLLAGIATLTAEPTRCIALVIVSSVLRDASRQDPKQVRVGRRPASDDIPDLDLLVDNALDQALESLAATRAVAEINWDGISRALSRVRFGDARRLRESLNGSGGAGTFDAVVTSPPYANALPYIDTDRLSLRAFGMLKDGGQRAAEQRLIGNREINTSDSRSLNAQVDAALARSNSLPVALRTVLSAARDAAQEATAGFRRQRTPGLLWAYFRDMSSVLRETAELLKPGAPAVFVVGDSTITGAGDQVVDVPTTDILVALAAEHGLEVEHDLGKRLTSYGASSTVHQRNAMESERVVIFRRSVN
jgi:tRNA G10  N-methylase Trm11